MLQKLIIAIKYLSSDYVGQSDKKVLSRHSLIYSPLLQMTS